MLLIAEIFGESLGRTYHICITIDSSFYAVCERYNYYCSR